MGHTTTFGRKPYFPLFYRLLRYRRQRPTTYCFQRGGAKGHRRIIFQSRGLHKQASICPAIYHVSPTTLVLRFLVQGNTRRGRMRSRRRRRTSCPP